MHLPTTKQDVSLAALSLLLAGLTYSAMPAAPPIHAQDLGCPDITGCTGKAYCGEKGSHDGCVITCAGGSIINCGTS